MTKYTFTFDADEERKFRSIMDRLDPEEYTVLEEIKLLKPEEPRYSERQTIMEMDPEAALTFRMGMKNVKIRRERTEEELKAEAENDARHKVKVVVQVDPSMLPPKV
jgi:ArsR family metal-binding transcriptional regulator